MQITEIYVDQNGDTHFRDVPIGLTPRDFAPPSAPMGVSAEMPLTTGVFIELPAGLGPEISRIAATAVGDRSQGRASRYSHGRCDKGLQPWWRILAPR